jgi:hypothetical protein
LAPLPSPPPFSRQKAQPATNRKTVKNIQLADGRAGPCKGMGRSQIIRRQENLVLYKPFNTLCGRGFALRKGGKPCNEEAMSTSSGFFIKSFSVKLSYSEILSLSPPHHSTVIRDSREYYVVCSHHSIFRTQASSFEILARVLLQGSTRKMSI